MTVKVGDRVRFKDLTWYNGKEGTITDSDAKSSIYHVTVDWDGIPLWRFPSELELIEPKHPRTGVKYRTSYSENEYEFIETRTYTDSDGTSKQEWLFWSPSYGYRIAFKNIEFTPVPDKCPTCNQEVAG
jgi:hypothetical protein